MALSGLDIYKLLPKTNCRRCGFATCLAFAMQLVKKAVSLDKCLYLSEEVKQVLEVSAQPPIKLVTIGRGEESLEMGNETVMFRHEEKFHHPCGIGFMLPDSLGSTAIKEKLSQLDKLKFERVGQKLEINLLAIKQKAGKEKFIQVIQQVNQNSALALVLMSSDLLALEEALTIVKDRKPLVYPGNLDNLTAIAQLIKTFQVPIVATAQDLETLSQLSRELNNLGVNEIVLDTGKKPIREKIWDFTQLRRLALKKSMRSLGYPILATVNTEDTDAAAMEVATYIAKYANIILLEEIDDWNTLALLTLRQNIYTDPQKPLQIEPKLYPIGPVSVQSPLLVTTNFSLTYYTVLQEVEASKVPAYIVSVDTEGMSVLTAWAAEKFTPEKIADSLNKFGIKDIVAHQHLVIPGYVAVMSGELEEKSGWKVVVGPKEAAGIPAFLKKYGEIQGNILSGE